MRKQHGLSQYRRGCRCDVCLKANRDYMREYRARRRGLRLVVTAGDDEVDLGSVEASVQRELDSLSAAVSRPGLCAGILAMAKILDNPNLATTQPSAARQMNSGLQRIRDSSINRGGKLAVVASMSDRKPT
jgi:hypothetical protein